MSRLESSIERSVCDYAKKRGLFVRKMGGYGQRGFPDRMFMWRGRVLFVEFKQAGKKPTALQAECIRDLRERGFEVQIVDSVEFGRFVIDQFIAYTNEAVLTAGCRS